MKMESLRTRNHLPCSQGGNLHAQCWLAHRTTCWVEGFAQGRSHPVLLLSQKNISLTKEAPNGKTHRNVPWQDAGKASGR